jgi:hypothetical protein
MTNEQKAAILDDEAMWKEKIAHIAAQGDDNGRDRFDDLMARAALLREAAAEVDNRCGHCESALAAAALARPMVLQGIHCGHCGRLNRARGVGA